MFDLEDIAVFNIMVLFFGIAYGVIAQRSKFCFSGGLKDTIIIGNTQRSASILVAMITSVVATQVVAFVYDIDLEIPRYFLNINYIAITIGGLIFGYGMMKSDGCGSRHLVKFAQGDKTSLYVLIALSISSYFTYSYLEEIKALFFQNTLMSLFYTDKTLSIPSHFIITILLLALIRSLSSVKNLTRNIDGIGIGLLIAGGWYMSSVLSEDMFILTKTQSLSFIYPVGKIFEYTINSFDSSYLSFSVFSVFGVLAGAFISSKISSQKPKPKPKITTKSVTLIGQLFGGVCLGFGGILVIGCTVGQGLSGLSTLALASVVAIISIYVSAYLTGLNMHKHNLLSTSFKPPK